MFIDPDPDQLEASAEIGAPWVELHTGSFARAWYNPEKRDVELNTLREGMRIGVELGLRGVQVLLQFSSLPSKYLTLHPVFRDYTRHGQNFRYVVRPKEHLFPHLLPIDLDQDQ